MSVSFASAPSSKAKSAANAGGASSATAASATATAAIFTDGVLAAVGRHTADALQSYIIEQQDFVGSLGPAFAELFRLEQLPDNPYPFLLERLRAIELKQALTHAHPSNAIPAAPAENDLAAPDAKNQVTHARGSANFFGLPHIMRWVHLPSLTLLKHQLAEFLPTQVLQEDDCHVR